MYDEMFQVDMRFAGVIITNVLTQELLNKKKLPDAPGVYFFLGTPQSDEGGSGCGEILYIGKATSLRNRVKSYLSRDINATRGPKIVAMLSQVQDVKWRTTDSALEALLLEARLIKEYWPPYNTNEKDDKSWSYVIATKEKFPRILLVRERDLRERPEEYPVKWQFGPFLSKWVLTEALEIIRRIFPYRDTCLPVKIGTKSSRTCFNAQIGLCPGVCVGTVTAKEYAVNVRNIKLFFEGKKKQLVRLMKKDIEVAAKKLEFERANDLKHKVFLLEHIQDITLLKHDWEQDSVLFALDSRLSRRQGAADLSLQTDEHELVSVAVRIEAYDVAHTAGKEVVGAMVVIENGEAKKSKYRKFIVHSGNNDIQNLEEMLARRLRHTEWPWPQLIVVDGSDVQIRAAKKVLRAFGRQTVVVSVVKDARHQPKKLLGPAEVVSRYQKDILLANSEAHRFALDFHRKKRAKNFIGRV